MRIFYQAAAALRMIFHRSRVDRELAEEMRLHIERQTEENMRHGMTPHDAYRAARLAFGSVDDAQEVARDERSGRALQQLLMDARFGVRLLAKSPVFGATAVATIALGIGAATAIFSVVYGVMLRPLPFREPDRLVTIWLARGEGRSYPTAADAEELRRLPSVFRDVALVRSANLSLSLIGDGEPQRFQAARVSPNFFNVLGVTPTLGRAFAPDEDQLGRERVVLISDRLWRNRYGADSAIVGRHIRFDAGEFTVIGVMPAVMQYPTADLDGWIPAVLEPGELTRTAINNYRLVARLAPQVTIDQARREATTLAKRLGATYHQLTWSAGPGFTVDSMLDDATRVVRPALLLLLGAVSFLLIIASVNLSSLFGARAMARSGEFAVRLALGASRARLIAQSIAEAIPVLLLGGISGILIAQWGVRAFVASAPAGLPRVESISMSLPVLICSLSALIVAGVATSIAPALHAWRSDFTAVTKDASRSSTTGRRHLLARRTGVTAQIALALPLLIGATLLTESAMEIGRVQLGFRTDHVATIAFEVSRTKHESDQAVADYYARLTDAVSAIPGVASAAVTNRIPLVGAQTNSVRFENATTAVGEETIVDSRTVTPAFFSTLGVPLIAGRSFTNSDGSATPVVAIVDDRIARTVWPGQSAIGKRFRGPGDRVGTIVGVVGHVRTAGVGVDPLPQMYWSTRQWVQNRSVLAVQSNLEPNVLFPAVIKAIRSVDPEQAVYDPRTMREIVDRSLAQRTLTMRLMIGFGAMSLILAAVGIYGVMAYGVTQRLREFGIRVALGATPGEVVRIVVRQGAIMAFAGIAIGVSLSLAAAEAMRNLVYGVAPRDSSAIVAATGLLLGVAILASYVPARRAAGVDPAQTLRAE